MAILETTARSWREVEDWLDDAGWARHPDAVRPTLVYRGLPRASLTLVNSLQRRGLAFMGRERHLFRNFRKYAFRHGQADWSDWYWLSLARHYGLPTRLLDWTFAPLIALHFATERNLHEPAVVWAVDHARVHQTLPEEYRAELDAEGATLFTVDMLSRVAPRLDRFGGGRDDVALFFEPPSLEERIINQSAVFSVMSSPAAAFEEWLQAHPESARRLVMTSEAKEQTREHLDLNGINERLLFPGLAGLAAYLARYYSDPGEPELDPGGRDALPGPR